MRNFKKSEWHNGAKFRELPLTTNDTIELDVVSAGTITVEGVDQDGGTVILMSGQQHLHVKHKFEGFESLHITSTKEMGYRFIHKGIQLGEPIDDELPPEPKEPSNILQKMRTVIKQELAAQRESFLENDTGLPSHEVEDDEFEDAFEEEIMANRQQQLDKLNKSEANDGPPQKEDTSNGDKSEQPAETPAAS